MATTTFTSYMNKNIGLTAATVVTAGAGAQTNIIGMCCSNTTSTAVTVDVYITRSAVNYYILKGATVPVGGTLIIVGGDQKVVLITSDALKVVSSAAASLDVVTSVLNIT
jgi:hypothetical protein